MIKNILVTGRCGFIGSNVIRYLLREAGFSGPVIAVDNLTYAGNPENLSNTGNDLSERYAFIEVDLCDGRTCPVQLMPI